MASDIVISKRELVKLSREAAVVSALQKRYSNILPMTASKRDGGEVSKLLSHIIDKYWNPQQKALHDSFSVMGLAVFVLKTVTVVFEGKKYKVVYPRILDVGSYTIAGKWTEELEKEYSVEFGLNTMKCFVVESVRTSGLSISGDIQSELSSLLPEYLKLLRLEEEEQKIRDLAARPYVWITSVTRGGDVSEVAKSQAEYEKLIQMNFDEQGYPQTAKKEVEVDHKSRVVWLPENHSVEKNYHIPDPKLFDSGPARERFHDLVRSTLGVQVEVSRMTQFTIERDRQVLIESLQSVARDMGQAFEKMYQQIYPGEEDVVFSVPQRVSLDRESIAYLEDKGVIDKEHSHTLLLETHGIKKQKLGD